ncbi:vicilin-like seed storage protein At2g18540 [Eutrema salsugineum]|uniref:vicilin-like seed storage protein At2g18540 n=1 Tax=Eutrema salsugineum TaxID=72664 RepID=UPI000CED620B|nr:vicilin-like seed storage protein At2g18540 [Eutrema salsugineum]
MSKFTILPLCLVTLFICTSSFSDQNDDVPSFQSPLLIKKNQRTQIVETEFGEISAVQIGDGYNIQFITLEPNAFLLPLLLHSDMVFFVHTGIGILNWVDDDKERTLELRRGDIFRLRSGIVFYVHSNLERSEFPEKLRVYAIFDVGKCLHDPCIGAYSNIRDLLLGFDEKTLRSAFAVPEEILGRVRDEVKPPLITNAQPRNRTKGPEEETWQSRLGRLFVRVEDVTDHLAMKPVDNSKKKKSSAYNVFEADPDFKNVNGQSIVVDEKDTDDLKGSSVGVFMVNLTEGSLMGPHWNPSACEISIVLHGKGMIRVVNHSLPQSESKRKSESVRFMVEEGDVFVVPKFYPMAQMSFENSSFVFMGFSTSAKTNHPQFLVGQSSVLKVFDREVLAASFNVRNETIERLLGAQREALMLECVSCAEVELSRLMREIEERKRREEEETERRRQEEERKREEEAAKQREEERRRREEEEAERRRKEEEEARKREEEAAKKREEERRRREKEEEEARKREEEEAKRQEEERVRREKEEEEEARKKEEEEARKREEEREREEEEAKRQEEERKRREKEEEEARRREQEREREEEEAQRQEEERKRREKEEEELRKREEEREREEEEAQRQEEERVRREKEEEAARKREEEREREEEEAQRQEEERVRREKEQEKARRKEEEEARKREEEREREEEEARRQEEERIRREKEEEAARKREEEREKEEEMAKRQEEERQRKKREEAEKKRRQEEEAMKREERKREEEASKRAEEERRRREEEEKRRPPQPQPPTTDG